MKKMFLLTLLFPLLGAVSCNQGSLDMPKSPFNNDQYQRIGMQSEYQEYVLETTDYDAIKDAVDQYKSDTEVKNYTRETEQRDLKRAYFGNQETSTCSLTSRLDTNKRYDNDISISDTAEAKQKQLESGNVINDNSTVSKYNVDDGKDNKYHIVTESKKNDEAKIVTSEEYEYKEETKEEEKEALLGLTPFTTIKNHFVDIDFKLLADKNNAVYGKINIENNYYYLIKEAKSVFFDYQTVGHKYKAVNNYFYEGLLKDIGEKQLAFTAFRFYHEQLILSEPADSADVPVLYLDRPMLVAYDEYRYNISYTSVGNYSGDIPVPTK